MYDAINPLFICLGFPKCATTWIHRQLEDHPQISCTTTKEVTYWTKNYTKGKDWYVGQFPKGKDYKVYAEVTPHYVNESALSRMATDLTDIDVKFMVCLRNPYDRAYSHFQDIVRAGRAKDDLQKAINSAPEIIEQSLYGNRLTLFSKYFSLDKLYIDFYDNIESDPIDFVQRMYAFIGVDPTHIPDNLNKKVNTGRKSTTLDLILHKIGMFFRNNGLRREHLIKLGLWSSIEKVFEILSKRHPIPQMTEKQALLIGKLLKDDLNKLEPLIKNINPQSAKGFASFQPPFK